MKKIILLVIYLCVISLINASKNDVKIALIASEYTSGAQQLFFTNDSCFVYYSGAFVFSQKYRLIKRNKYYFIKLQYYDNVWDTIQEMNKTIILPQKLKIYKFTFLKK